MTPRHQRILFWILVTGIVGMAVLLFVGRHRERERISELADQSPIDAPNTAPETIMLSLASDSDGTIAPAERQLALPSETNARARALVDHLIAEYAVPGSAHPLPPGAAVNEVFLVPLPVTGRTPDPNASAGEPGGGTTTLPVPSTDPNALLPQSPGGELAVIDLRGSFVNAHPSGVEVEALTLASIVGTLHANLPAIEQIRFLVDGQSRETLAGHADLLRTYPSRDTAVAVDATAPGP